MRDMSAWMGLFLLFICVWRRLVFDFIRDAQFYTMYYFILPRAEAYTPRQFFDLKIGNCSASHAGLSHSVRYCETLGVSFGTLGGARGGMRSDLDCGP
ncbi:hypothetical protein V8C43DRAFT_59865 [Trichoderma afarasin]